MCAILFVPYFVDKVNKEAIYWSTKWSYEGKSHKYQLSLQELLNLLTIYWNDNIDALDG